MQSFFKPFLNFILLQSLQKQKKPELQASSVYWRLNSFCFMLTNRIQINIRLTQLTGDSEISWWSPLLWPLARWIYCHSHQDTDESQHGVCFGNAWSHESNVLPHLPCDWRGRRLYVFILPSGYLNYKVSSVNTNQNEDTEIKNWINHSRYLYVSGWQNVGNSWNVLFRIFLRLLNSLICICKLQMHWLFHELLKISFIKKFAKATC